jgi:hypothetical protein
MIRSIVSFVLGYYSCRCWCNGSVGGWVIRPRAADETVHFPITFAPTMLMFQVTLFQRSVAAVVWALPSPGSN